MIEGLDKYQKRHTKGCYFEGLPPHLRAYAGHWLQRLIKKRRARGKPVRGWVFGILVGQAKRLALHPPSPEWGRSMRAKRGGYAVQRRYRWEGRNPTAKATLVRLARQRAKAGREEPPVEGLTSASVPALSTPFASVTVSQGRMVR